MGRCSKHIAKRPVNAQHVPNTLDAPRTLGNAPQAIKTVETLRTLGNTAKKHCLVLQKRCMPPKHSGTLGKNPRTLQTLNRRPGTLLGHSQTLKALCWVSGGTVRRPVVRPAHKDIWGHSQERLQVFETYQDAPGAGCNSPRHFPVLWKC